MPKMKTHSGTKKRFKLTATGLVKRGRPGTSHLAPGKTQKRVRHLRKSATVCSSDLKRIRQQIANIK
ncbi:MAG: 50S ribosomal protein L35 [Bacilli bacterium]|jgi:large subunit ribosomal protein L35|nr:50S ribosomal protein L35 [Bacilli bacterium]MDY0063455.1 50S ribosomal protein L35 [Bacilli bacterium]